MDYNPEVLIDAEEIANRVKVLGAQISEDYKGQELTVICILKGGFIFCSDLVRRLNVPTKIEYMMLSSYGAGKVSSGEPKIELDITGPVEGKNILVVEDIIDTGNTMNFLEMLLKQRKARSVKLAALLYKPGKSRYNTKIDYLGFEIEDKFVIGYGLDYAGRYRELPYVGILNAGH
ncbi:MAG: hypoxanthine phosphoribosyltransferase [Bacteriovoracaceae bacterium]